ncbi:MAG TPA: hypothetical protein VFK80_08410 [Limnochordia bacterium]|nr:hypothetical protein [Limnochordia bacterium]
MADPINLRRVRREGRIHYGPAWEVYGSGALAAALMLWSPIVLRALINLFADLGEWATTGPGFGNGFLVINRIWMAHYFLSTAWPFLAVVVGGGLLFTWLRRRHGLYKWSVPSRAYGRRAPWGVPTALLIATLGVPILLVVMAEIYDPAVYPGVLFSNFALWLPSGYAGYYAWLGLQDGLLALRPEPRRRLEFEVAVREALDADPDLFHARIDAIRHDGAGEIRIEGNGWNESRRKRARALLDRAGLDGLALSFAEVESPPDSSPLWWL